MTSWSTSHGYRIPTRPRKSLACRAGSRKDRYPDARPLVRAIGVALAHIVRRGLCNVRKRTTDRANDLDRRLLALLVLGDPEGADRAGNRPNPEPDRFWLAF